MRSAEFRVRSSECGVRNSEFRGFRVQQGLGFTSSGIFGPAAFRPEGLNMPAWGTVPGRNCDSALVNLGTSLFGYLLG